MSFRALDGARCPAGIDEDSAHATAWLEAIGLPGLTLLADAIDISEPDARALGLETHQTSASTLVIGAAGLPCGFYAAAVIDLLIATAETSPDGCSTIELNDTRHPLFLIAMAARFRPPHGTIEMAWRQSGMDIEFTVTPAGVLLHETGGDDLDWTDASSIGSVRLTCRTDSGTHNVSGRDIAECFAKTLRHGLDVEDRAYARVAAHAAKVLVPETETSRVSGAGAGLTDND